MSDSWRRVPVREALESLDSRRRPVKSADRKPGPYPYWGASGVVDHVDDFLFDEPTLLISEDGENLRTRKTPIAFHVTGRYWVNNHAHVFRAREGHDLRFHAYQFQMIDVSGYISGSTQPKLTAAAASSIPLAAPPIDEQRRIAQVLGALDDLIDANERTRASLGALVNAEFERRFGLRPPGPTVGDLAKVVDCLHSKKPEQLTDGHRLLLQLNNIRDDGLMDLEARYLISENDYARWSKNLETEAHDLVVTNVGRVGAVARVPAGMVAALGRNMTGVRTNEPGVDAAFMAVALLSPSVRREIENKTDSGTILNALNVRSIPKLRLQASTAEERKLFSSWALPLLEMCDSLIAHNLQLRRTRDDLLPLLMSGAVRVRPEGTVA